MISSTALKLIRSSKRVRTTARLERSLLKYSVFKTQGGYTLLELLVVVMLAGIIAAIAAPGWLSFTNQRRVGAANDAVLRALQDAQSQAKSKKVSYSVSFRNELGKAPEVAVYPSKIPAPGNAGALQYVDPYTADFNGWRPLGENLGLKPGQVMLQTNVGTVGSANQVIGSPSGTGTITFDYMGALPPENPSPNLGGTPGNPKGLIVMVAAPKGNNPIPSSQRCIKIMTLLGSTRIQRADQCNF
jgi:prepilin-type N-terminal cleavage/methylation domain-containing protein